jgi:hypothetical protein
MKGSSEHICAWSFARRYPMSHPIFRKVNHLAILGFLLPFVSAALACAYVLYGPGDYVSIKFWLFFVVLIPVLLGFGLFLSIKSIPHIVEKGDKDYAYSGLVLNIFFILLYLFSLSYILYTRSR